VGYDVVTISSQANVYEFLAQFPGIRKDKFEILKVGSPTNDDVENFAKSLGVSQEET
jgi:hypothetical protein